MSEASAVLAEALRNNRTTLHGLEVRRWGKHVKCWTFADPPHGFAQVCDGTSLYAAIESVGVVTKATLERALLRLNVPIEDKQLDGWLAELDADEDGGLAEDDVVAALSRGSSATPSSDFESAEAELEVVAVRRGADRTQIEESEPSNGGRGRYRLTGCVLVVDDAVPCHARSAQ